MCYYGPRGQRNRANLASLRVRCCGGCELDVETSRHKGGASSEGSGINFRQTLSSLRYRDFRRLWLSQLGSSSSQWMEIVARGWLVYEMTDSPFLLGLVSAVRTVPMLFFGIFGGVLADRLDRRNLLVVSIFINMFLNLVLAVLIVTGAVEVWHVFVTAFLAGTVMSFQQPAKQALIPSLVGERELMNAIALNSAAINMMRSIGPAAAGLLVGLTGMAGTYFAQAGLLLLSGFLSYSIKVPPTAGPPRKSSMSHDLKEGFGYVRSNETILTLLILALIPMLLGTPYTTMMPVFAKDVLSIGPEGLGVLMSAPGIGAFIGATLIASLNNFRRKGLLLLIGAGLFGFTLVIFSFSQWVVVSFVVLIVVGTANSGYMAINNTLLQTHTPDDLRGRVMSIYLLDRGLGPLGTMLAGTLTSFMGAPVSLGLMGGACFLLAIGVAIARPSVRRLK